MLKHYVRHFYCDSTITTSEILEETIKEINFPEDSYCCYFYSRDDDCKKTTNQSGMIFNGGDVYSFTAFEQMHGENNYYKSFILRCRMNKINRIVITKCGRAYPLCAKDIIYNSQGMLID